MIYIRICIINIIQNLYINHFYGLYPCHFLRARAYVIGPGADGTEGMAKSKGKKRQGQNKVA